MKKCVLLVYPHVSAGWQVQPTAAIPTGLLCLAPPLISEGYDVKIIDLRVEPDWRSVLQQELEKHPICVGVSSMTGPQLRHALEVSRIVREHNHSPVVWGGTHASLLPAQTLDNGNIDIIVQGEGEETFLELVQALDGKRPLSTVRGIWYKENAETKNTGARPLIDLNKQPPVPYHLIDLKKFARKMYGVEHLDFFTSRGCPYQCTFCYNVTFHNKRWRPMDPDLVVQRLKDLVQTYQVRGLYFNDSNFFVDLNRGRKILEGMIRENLNVLISRINIDFHSIIKMSEEDFVLLQRAGCKRFPVSIESGSERIRTLLKKPIDVPRILEINRFLTRFDMVPSYSFMMGFPTETRDELHESVALAFRLLDENPKAETSFNIYTPFPGTELFDLTVAHGLRPPQRLEDWGAFTYRNLTQGAPWLSAEMRRLVEMLDFCNFFVGKKTFHESFAATNPLGAALTAVYAPVAQQRMRHFWSRFPVEIKLAKRLKLYARQD